MILARLRSRKRSGSASGCDTEHVLELIGRNTELRRELVERVASPEPLVHVVDPHAAALEDGGSKGPSRVGDDLCASACSPGTTRAETVPLAFEERHQIVATD